MFRCSVTNTEAIGVSIQCRCDAKFLSFISQDNWNAFRCKGKLCTLSGFLSPAPIKKVAKGVLDEGSYLINISDQEPSDGILDMRKVVMVDEVNSDKNILSCADIIVSKLGMPKGYIYLLPKLEKSIIGSTEFIPYSIKRPKAEYFILYMLLMPEIRQAYSRLETGKTPSHKRVTPEEFLKIRVPQIQDNDDLIRSNESVRALALRIGELLGKIEPVQNKIEEVFSREFQYEPNTSRRFGKGVSQPTQSLPERGCSISFVDSASFSRSDMLRMSTRYNNNITKELAKTLGRAPTVKLGSIISEPVHRGCSPNYTADGEIPVVKTAHLINGNVLVSDEEFVSSREYEKNTRAQVQFGDLLIASTGKGSIGKFAIVREEIRLYADSHISIVRIDKSQYNPEFAFYFFQSVLGYFQIERDYTGCTNQVEIDKDSIEKFLLPDISLEKQSQIVSEIRQEIAKQEDIRTEISSLRGKIDMIIRNTFETAE